MSIRVGIVGWGEIAREHAAHFAANGAELAGVISRRNDLGLNVPVYRHLNEMLPHVDAVTIAVPNHLHASLCLEAIQANTPVLVEKPLCISRNELAELERSFQTLSVPVHLGYRLRWNPSMIALKKRLGNVRRIRCTYTIGIEPLAANNDWTRQYATTGGTFFAIGVHALDLARWLANANGQPLIDLRASASNQDKSADYPLKVQLSGTLPSGVEIFSGADLRGNAESRIELKISADDEIEVTPPAPEEESTEYAGLIADFIEAVRTNRVDTNYTDEVLQTHRELLLARELSERGSGAGDAHSSP